MKLLNILTLFAFAIFMGCILDMWIEGKYAVENHIWNGFFASSLLIMILSMIINSLNNIPGRPLSAENSGIDLNEFSETP